MSCAWRENISENIRMNQIVAAKPCAADDASSSFEERTERGCTFGASARANVT